MEAGVVRSFVQSVLKLVNSVIGMVGIAMVLYSIWMFRVWQKHMDGDNNSAPWFIYVFLGLGLTLCVSTCSGHIAAETVNGCCLYCYMVFVVLLLMLEAAVTLDVLLNRNWEEDFPEDPSGQFNEFKDFVRKNFDTCKWIGLSVVAVQGLSMILAMILKALGLHRESYHDSDEDYAPDGVPLLKNYVHQSPYVLGDPLYGSKKDSWNIRINSKPNR